MKILMRYFIPVVLLLAGCKKEKSIEHSGATGGGTGGGTNTDYFLKAKIGSDSKTFNISLFASKQDAGGGITVYTIAGKANSNATDHESFVISINSSSPLVAGTYKVDDVSTAYSMFGIYNPNSQTILIGSGTGDTGPTAFQVTITSISTTEVAGTFKGTLFEDDSSILIPPPNPPTREVTGGEFKAKFQ